VRGQLDKEIIRRIVRRHVNEVKYCYDQALARQPKLDGRLVTQFTISGTGQVLASVVQSSTLQSPAVEMCVVNAVKRWQFPAPEKGGLVIVSYPFQFSPAGG
jgi:TonB family protein